MPLKGRILFDQGHWEDPLAHLIKKLPEEGFLYEINTKLLTEDKLNQYTALVLNNPKYEFSKDEIDIIKNYVNNDGGLLLTSSLKGEEDSNSSANEILKKFVDASFIFEDFQSNFSIIYYRSKSNSEKISGKIKVDYNISQNHPTTRNVINVIEGLNGLTYLLYHYKPNVIIKRSFSLESLTPDNFNYSKGIKIGDEIIEKPEDLKKILFPITYNYHPINWNLARRDFLHELNTCYSTLGIARYVKRGSFVALTGNLFDDDLIEKDVNKNANLKLAINILEWLSQPTLHKVKVKTKIMPSYVHP